MQQNTCLTRVKSSGWRFPSLISDLKQPRSLLTDESGALMGTFAEFYHDVSIIGRSPRMVHQAKADHINMLCSSVACGSCAEKVGADPENPLTPRGAQLNAICKQLFGFTPRLEEKLIF